MQHSGEVAQTLARITEGRTRFPLSFGHKRNEVARRSETLVLAAVRNGWADMPEVVITLES